MVSSKERIWDSKRYPVHEDLERRLNLIISFSTYPDSAKLIMEDLARQMHLKGREDEFKNTRNMLERQGLCTSA